MSSMSLTGLLQRDRDRKNAATIEQYQQLVTTMIERLDAAPLGSGETVASRLSEDEVSTLGDVFEALRDTDPASFESDVQTGLSLRRARGRLAVTRDRVADMRPLTVIEGDLTVEDEIGDIIAEVARRPSEALEMERRQLKSATEGRDANEYVFVNTRRQFSALMAGSAELED